MSTQKKYALYTRSNADAPRFDATHVVDRRTEVPNNLRYHTVYDRHTASLSNAINNHTTGHNYPSFLGSFICEFDSEEELLQTHPELLL